MSEFRLRWARPARVLIHDSPPPKPRRRRSIAWRLYAPTRSPTKNGRPKPPVVWSRNGDGRSAFADHVERDIRQAGKAERMRGGRRQVDHAAAHERAAVIDAHHDRAAGRAIGDPHHGAKRQAAMRRSERT